MRIDNKTDPPNTGRLHVDFAQARDDQYEWECKQRQLQREARHRDRVEKERYIFILGFFFCPLIHGVSGNSCVTVM